MPQTATHAYSTLFSCLYDEQQPVGQLGRGTHYSVFRCVEPLDVIRQVSARPQIHDFAVLWDEDHDERVIALIEQLYAANLFSPIQFIGERKGTLYVVAASRLIWTGSDTHYEAWKEAVAELAAEGNHQDDWPVEFGTFDRSGPFQTELPAIISDAKAKVETYLRNIDNLWRLGTREFKASDSLVAPRYQPPVNITLTPAPPKPAKPALPPHPSI